MPCLRNHRLRLAKSRALGERLAPRSPETRVNASLGGSGEGVRLRLGPERPLVTSLRSAAAHPSLRPDEGTRRFGAAELRALQTAASERASRPRLLGSRGPPGRALSNPARSPPESPARAGARRPAPSSPPLLLRSLRLQTALPPHLGAARQSPAARDLSAAAAPVLPGAPRRLPRRRSRHTWGARGSKLGGDVNGPGRTSPQTGAAGWAGWDGEKVTRPPQRRPPQRRSNDIGEGGGDRGDAPSHSARSLCPRPRPGAFGAELGVAAAPGPSD